MVGEARPGMRDAQLRWHGFFWLVLLCGLVLGPGLGSASRLTYHEAFVAQGAREIVATGQWWHPAIGGLPWLEKPPLPFWLVAGLGRAAGGVDAFLARLPSAAAALGLVVGVCLLAWSHYGPRVGVLAGAVQATTAWTVLRGRLAEADMLLACLIAWSLLALDRLRLRAPDRAGARGWRWAFFGLLGLSALVKGTGFGAALILATAAVLLLWEHDGEALRRLRSVPGWTLAAVLTLAWPLAMIARHGIGVGGLWVLHVTERLGTQAGHGPFAGESWPEYVLNVLAQGLPWTPLALLGAAGSLGRLLRPFLTAGAGAGADADEVEGSAARGPAVLQGDRLLWAWAVAPLLLVSVARARNAHYAIHAMAPWSVWAALGLERLGAWLARRGRPPARLRRVALGAITALAAAYGLGFWLLGPVLDRRGREWAFYEAVGRRLPVAEPLVLLYDDWDRDPYPTPFGPIPHDLAVRLFYLDRPACWHFEADRLAAHDRACMPGPGSDRGSAPPAGSLAVLGRRRDLPALGRLGRIEVLAEGPAERRDRTYLVARLRPESEPAPEPEAAEPAPPPPPPGRSRAG